MARSLITAFEAPLSTGSSNTIVFGAVNIPAGSLVVIGGGFELAPGATRTVGSISDSSGATGWQIFQDTSDTRSWVAYKFNHPGGTAVVITANIPEDTGGSYRSGDGGVFSGTVGEIDPRTLAPQFSSTPNTGASSFTFSMPGDGMLFAAVCSFASLPSFAATSPAAQVGTTDTPANYSACMWQLTTGAGNKTIASTGGQAYLMNGTALAFNDPALPPSGPVITGPSGAAGASTSSKSVAENTSAVHTFTADVAVTWSLNGGADAARFAINSSTGALAFITAPDYEAPNDSDTNNTYIVVVRATATTGGATADQTVTVTVTNVAEPPLAPTIGTATAGNASASVSFTPPTNTGRPSITGYTVTSSPGGFTATGAGSPINVTGLANGTAYTFTVTATNSEGTGPASAASNSVTPSAGGGGGGAKVPAVLLSRLLTPRS